MITEFRVRETNFQTDVPILKPLCPKERFVVKYPDPFMRLFKQSLLYQGPILWSGLSTDLKCSNNVMDFKRLYKQQM